MAPKRGKGGYGYRGPSVDHTVLSPSGRVSKRVREAALKREAARLFPVGYFDPREKTSAEKVREKAVALRRSAQNLRDLAARGMSPRKFAREAERMEAEAAALEGASITDTPTDRAIAAAE